jgi:hypothetical protein
MSEFQIERDPTPKEPSRSVDSSEQTDADGGGGMTFVFGGGDGGAGGRKEEQPKRNPPAPIGPPVELSLSSSACRDIGLEAPDGDFGSIGPVNPPEGIEDAVKKTLAEAKVLDASDALAKPNSSRPGSIVDLEI